MEKPDIPGLFEPEQQSAALLFLRRLVGCTFDYIWTPGNGGNGTGGGSCDNTNDILALLITTLNWAMLAVIAGVATYLIFAAIKDTANDGEVGGRSMNPSWTLVMAGIAALLCFPAFGGFSALQMATMKVAVWSTGLGDQTWRIAADKMASGAAVNATFRNIGDNGDWFADDPSTAASLHAQIAEAVRSRVGGELCARTLTSAASNMATTDATFTSAQQVNQPSTNGQGSVVLYYLSGAGFGEGTGVCGSVTVNYMKLGELQTLPWESSDAPYLPDNEAAQAEIAKQLRKYIGEASEAGAMELATAVQDVSGPLADQLFPANGPRLQGDAQLAAITNAVQQVISRSRTKIAQALGNAPADIMKATSDSMLRQRESGWMYAILYQRILANATSGLANLGRGTMQVAAMPPTENLANVLGCSGGMTGRSCGSTAEVFFGQYETDRASLDQLKGAFGAAISGRTGVGSSEDNISWSDWLQLDLQQILNRALMAMGGVENTDGWSDPIPEMQKTGGNFLGLGSVFLLIAKGGEFLSEWMVSNASGIGLAVGEIMQLAGPIGWLLVTLGFLLAVVVPFMPLVYFFLAALSWLVLAMQTIICAPFWLMQMFYPNRSGGISGTSVGRTLNVLLALLMRPALIIIGLVFCMLLMRVGLDILNVLSRNAIVAMSIAGGNPLGSGIASLALSVGGFFIYVSMCVALVSVCCGLIDGVSEFVMEMVESGTSKVFGSEGRHRSEGVLGNPATAAAAGIALGGRGMLAGTSSRVGRLGTAKANQQSNALSPPKK